MAREKHGVTIARDAFTAEAYHRTVKGSPAAAVTSPIPIRKGSGRPVSADRSICTTGSRGRGSTAWSAWHREGSRGRS
jgi:hypothetical protein